MIRPNTDAILLLIWKLLDAGRVDEAQRMAQGLVEISDSCASWHALAQTLEAKRRWSAAINALENALIRAPKNRDIQQNLNRLNLILKDTSDNSKDRTP